MLTLDDIIIDPEFRDFLPALEERDRLAAKIELEGWSAEEITVWQHHNILLDGHNRYAIWKERGDDGPPIREMKFASREAAFYWMVNNQCARRNLTPEQQKYLLGRKYTAEKAVKGGYSNVEAGKKSNHQNDDSISDNNVTAKRLGKELGVGQSTIERAERYANAVDDLDKKGIVAKSDILSGKVKVPAQTVVAASKAETPDEAKRVLSGKKQTNEPSPVAYDLENERKRQVATKNYQRLGILLGQTQAIADGLEAINLDAAMAVLTKDDADGWIEDARRTMAALKDLSTRLKKESERVVRPQVQEA